MKLFLKSIVFMFLLLATGKVAMASTLNGTITFTGSGKVTATGITFKGAGLAVATTGTYDLSGFQAGHAASFTNIFSFAEISPKNGGELMFSVISNNSTQLLQFKVDNYGMVNGKLTFYGTLSLYARGTTNGKETTTLISSNEATLTYTENPDGTTFSASISTAPEPSSLILLGTGLVGAAALLTRRRRQMVTA